MKWHPGPERGLDDAGYCNHSEKLASITQPLTQRKEAWIMQAMGKLEGNFGESFDGEFLSRELLRMRSRRVEVVRLGLRTHIDHILP